MKLFAVKALLFKIIIIVSFCNSLHSQANFNKYSFIDSLVTSSKIHGKNPEEFASALVSSINLNSDIEKVRAIYFWIISNIEYHLPRRLPLYNLLLSNNMEREIENTFVKRKGKCTGFAWLFEKMCNAIDIECYSIPGYSYDNTSCDINNFFYKNHIWNCIRIEDTWYLLDLTWDAWGWQSFGIYDSINFISTPEEFIYDHLPANPIWQFLPDPLSISDFCNRKIPGSEIKILSLNYSDSIQKWKNSNELDKLLFDTYHAYLFNPLLSHDYGLALMLKGLNIAYKGSDNMTDYISNLELGRECLLEALVYLKPYIIASTDEGIYSMKANAYLASGRFVKRAIRSIERQIIRLK